MQVISRFGTRFWLCLALIFGLCSVAVAERPRPLGWAMDAMRAGNWDTAATLATKDGAVAADVIEWHRLRAGLGSYENVRDFLARRTDWPGEALLRRKSEDAVIKAGDDAVLAFFAAQTPQTPRGVLAYAAAQTAAGQTGEAQATVVLAWRTMEMNDTSHARFMAEHSDVLLNHHEGRTNNMLWEGSLTDVRRMFDLIPTAQVKLARARIALQNLSGDANALIDAVPEALQNDAGLAYDRFVWRARKGRSASAKDLLIATSTSAKALGQPEQWSNRRRSLARDEMRDGDAKRAYTIASQHFLTGGSAYADLEWLAGFIALRKLDDPKTALTHFQNHRNVIESPISRGRAGYWIGRAHEAMGDIAAADQAYADGAQFQTSFYGLLAAERADLPFDSNLAGRAAIPDWRTSAMANDPLFEAGLLLQASGELDVAERFWTHYAEQLDEGAAAQLGQAAIDAEQPHLAVMIGKRVAYRGITLAAPYYALHPLAQAKLPMAAEMSLAIARRESEFDPIVQSGVGARGLMQIMPATAKEVAQGLGRSSEHSTGRLTSDPVYNAELGSKFLSTLAGRFDGNVVMMSAAYNAGPSRPIRWSGLYGDPRSANVDVIDWIEQIPFRETRNYVMRVTESLPVYRARLGNDPLPVPFSDEIKGSTLKAFAPKGE
ncbi:MAG: lytic transglycosylase domain-containing protein [Ascidiaceihabitans sp.]|nr:lytic transglycosylase domain-containing protein [Ascidiaceihabitans sp.]